MKRSFFSKALCRVWIAGSSLFLVGGCALSDAQMTSIAQSLTSTALNAILVGWLSCLFPAATA